MLNFIDGHKKFEERYTKVYKGPSKGDAGSKQPLSRQVRRKIPTLLAFVLGNVDRGIHLQVLRRTWRMPRQRNLSRIRFTSGH